MMQKRLKTEQRRTNLTPEEQFRFRNKYSAKQQALRIVEKIADGFPRKKSTGILYLDIEKASDKVWHQGLIYKLFNAGINIKLIKAIQSFLSKRTFDVKVREAQC